MRTRVLTTSRERDEALSWVKRAEDQLLHHRQKEKADQLQVQSLVESSQAANDRRHKVTNMVHCTDIFIEHHFPNMVWIGCLA